MEITSLTTARASLYKLAQYAIDSHEPITLTGKNGSVVMLSLEDYEALQETLYILQTMPGIAAEAKKAKTASKKELHSRDDLPW